MLDTSYAARGGGSNATVVNGGRSDSSPTQTYSHSFAKQQQQPTTPLNEEKRPTKVEQPKEQEDPKPNFDSSSLQKQNKDDEMEDGMFPKQAGESIDSGGIVSRFNQIIEDVGLVYSMLHESSEDGGELFIVSDKDQNEIRRFEISPDRRSITQKEFDLQTTDVDGDVKSDDAGPITESGSLGDGSGAVQLAHFERLFEMKKSGEDVMMEKLQSLYKVVKKSAEEAAKNDDKDEMERLFLNAVWQVTLIKGQKVEEGDGGTGSSETPFGSSEDGNFAAA